MPIDLDRIANPKRAFGRLSGRSSWYSFYPGFSDAFSDSVLGATNESQSSIVLDPWNGAGTTTSAAAGRGLAAIGMDLNPAMVVVARARLLDPLDAPSLRPLAKQILKAAASDSSEIAADEPLNKLYWSSGSFALRAIERSIRKVLIDTSKGGGLEAYIDEMTPIACFFYVALFRAAKRLLSRHAGSNPVWTKMRLSPQARARPEPKRVRRVFFEECELMCLAESSGRPRARATSPVIQIKLGSSTRLPIDTGSIQLTLTSPPYCTRIDYAVATLPELAILGYDRDSTFDKLRRQLLGTTTVARSCDPIDERWGPTCLRFLDAVRSHSSRASDTYYLKNHVRYFSELFQSIEELKRVTSKSGRVVLVVQDSYYKDVHNDLPRTIAEMGESAGFAFTGAKNFLIKQLLAGANPKVHKYRGKKVSAVESVVTFEAR
jgi:hypothetical protein